MLQKFTNQFVNITLIANEICARKSGAKQKKLVESFSRPATNYSCLPVFLFYLGIRCLRTFFLVFRYIPTLNGTKGRLLAKDFRKKKQRIGKDEVQFFLQLLILPSKNQALIFILYFTSSFISLVLLLNNFCLSKVRSTLKNGQTVFF